MAISKNELVLKLKDMGVRVEGNLVRKSDLTKISLVAAIRKVLSKYGIKEDHNWFFLISDYWGDRSATPTERQKVSDPTNFPFKIYAKLKSGKEIGYALVDHKNKRECFIHEVDVEKKHRKKGVATAMYDFAEKLTGKSVIPSSLAYEDSEQHLSEDATKFWQKRLKDPEFGSEHEG
jgi:predicted GNAT family acetyltransferase